MQKCSWMYKSYLLSTNIRLKTSKLFKHSDMCQLYKYTFPTCKMQYEGKLQIFSMNFPHNLNSHLPKSSRIILLFEILHSSGSAFNFFIFFFLFYKEKDHKSYISSYLKTLVLSRHKACTFFLLYTSCCRHWEGKMQVHEKGKNTEFQHRSFLREY